MWCTVANRASDFIALTFMSWHRRGGVIPPPIQISIWTHTVVDAWLLWNRPPSSRASPDCSDVEDAELLLADLPNELA